MNNTYPSIASVTLGLRFGRGVAWRGGAVPSFLLIGHSMSKGIKKRQPGLHRLLLAVAFNYFN